MCLMTPNTEQPAPGHQKQEQKDLRRDGEAKQGGRVAVLKVRIGNEHTDDGVPEENNESRARDDVDSRSLGHSGFGDVGAHRLHSKAELTISLQLEDTEDVRH